LAPDASVVPQIKRNRKEMLDMVAPLIVQASSSRAIVLCENDLSASDRDVATILDFFGIPWTALAISDNAVNGVQPNENPSGNFSILTSAAVLAKALLGEGPDLPWFVTKADSIYVHGFEGADSDRDLLKLLSGDCAASIGSLPHTPTVLSIASDLPGLCGAMSGLTVTFVPSDSDQAFDLHSGAPVVHRIISTQRGNIFVKIMFQGVPFFLSASRRIIQLHSIARESFDVKKFFGSAVPIVMYLRSAFAAVCWRTPETSACLIIDDPLMRPRHGFLDFRRALELMDRHDFTMSVAFIPWNWRRTHPDAVKLFQQRPDRFSVSVHGCDHMTSEFATRSLPELNARTKIAKQRMEALDKRTSLRHERIMIFPQGAFSPEAGRVLKLNGFVAAVNTEVVPSLDSANQTEIADLWDVAITKYGTLALFTRRYLTHGIENFAFDVLLGKPCLIVAHHQEFKTNGDFLMVAVDRLNSLRCKLVWRSLGEVVSHSFRMRTDRDGTAILQMYGNHLHVENSSDQPYNVAFLKEESDPDSLRAILLNERQLEWTFQGKFVQFRATIAAKESMHLRTVYSDTLGQLSYPYDVSYRVGAALKRYLSEARDNYLRKVSQ
jgi:hypothetical protein